MGRPMMGEWGWRPLAALALAGGMLAACAPPVLTATPISGNAANSRFDNVARGASPEDSARISGSIRRFMVERGDNRPERLKQLVADAGGQCQEIGIETRCVINRDYVNRGCFRGACSLSRRRWDLFISWFRTNTETVEPVVRMVIKPVVLIQGA